MEYGEDDDDGQDDGTMGRMMVMGVWVYGNGTVIACDCDIEGKHFE